MSANPVANGGTQLRDLRLPDWREYGVEVATPGTSTHEASGVLGGWLRDVTEQNQSNFLTFVPDELASNRLQDILEVTGRDWHALIGEFDVKLDPQDAAARPGGRHRRQPPCTSSAARTGPAMKEVSRRSRPWTSPNAIDSPPSNPLAVQTITTSPAPHFRSVLTLRGYRRRAARRG